MKARAKQITLPKGVVRNDVESAQRMALDTARQQYVPGDKVRKIALVAAHYYRSTNN